MEEELEDHPATYADNEMVSQPDAFDEVKTKKDAKVVSKADKKNAKIEQTENTPAL